MMLFSMEKSNATSTLLRTQRQMSISKFKFTLVWSAMFSILKLFLKTIMPESFRWQILEVLNLWFHHKIDQSMQQKLAFITYVCFLQWRAHTQCSYKKLLLMLHIILSRMGGINKERFKVKIWVYTFTKLLLYNLNMKTYNLNSY